MILLSKFPSLKQSLWSSSLSSRGVSGSRTLGLEPKTPQTSAPLQRHQLVTRELKWSCVNPPAPYKWPQPRVVIVGAGIAGLVAAWRLHSAGIKDIVILEALNRAGGRVDTRTVGNTTVELGSDLLYGCAITNPLFNISVEEKTVDERLERKYLSGPYFTSTGRVISEVGRPISLFSSVVQETSLQPCRGKASVKSELSYRLKQALTEQEPSLNTEEVSCVFNGLENESRVRWGDDLESLSPALLASSRERVPPIIKLNKIGAKRLLEPFLAAVGGKIRYKKPVQSIRWRADFLEGSLRGGVLCCDGEEHEADFVLCTVSLGVLKAQAETLFSPPLPQGKLEAVEKLGFGSVNKIYLSYDRPFWIPSEGGLKIGWSSEEFSKRDSWLKGIGAIEEVSPNVLGISVAGREAVWTESCTDTNIAEELTAFLRRFTGNPGIPCPKTVTRSRWCSDVFFNGSKSYLGLESSPSLSVCLGCPLPDPDSPVLLFAGEATCPVAIGSMCGATMSGLREADRLVKICNRFRGPPRAVPEDLSLKPCPQALSATSG